MVLHPPIHSHARARSRKHRIVQESRAPIQKERKRERNGPPKVTESKLQVPSPCNSPTSTLHQRYLKKNMSYSGNTVAQLKELLKQRNLSTDGLKADLITRLQEDDAKNAAAEPKPADASSQAENKTESTTESTTAQENKDETTHQSAVQTGTEAGAQAPAQEDPVPAETSAQTPAQPAKPQLSPEQLKQTAIDHLQKKIHRAEKFGQDDSIVENLKRQINRIEKFGLDLTTQLAQELGFGKGPRAAIGKPNRKPFQKKHKNKKNIKRN